MLNTLLTLKRTRISFCLALACLALQPAVMRAQEKPYFVTYSHDLEEPGNLEVETKSALADPEGGNTFGAMALEFEYGVRAWWTSELYLDGQTTANESTLFTGYRLENRFRPLMREHVVNPVLYVEYESITGADKNLLEIVGHDGEADLIDPNHESSQEEKHEAELKLILSSNLKAWNISENFIAEKNLAHSPWEFGYALGAARPLRAAGGGRVCTFCLSKLVAGAELYGGLGDTWDLSLHDTSHYAAVLLGWQLPKSMRISFSPGFGITGTSLNQLYRIGFAYEVPEIGDWFRHGNGGVR